jgi:hypothetical protein
MPSPCAGFIRSVSQPLALANRQLVCATNRVARNRLTLQTVMHGRASGEVILLIQLSAEGYRQLQELAQSLGGQTPEAWARKHIERSTKEILRIRRRHAEDRAIAARYDPSENPVNRGFVEEVARVREACVKLEQALATLVLPGERGGFVLGENAHEVYSAALETGYAIAGMRSHLGLTVFDRDW